MLLRLLPLYLLFALVGGCGLLPDQIDETKDWSAAKFYSEASEALADGAYDQAIKYYESLEARYPFGRYSKQAQLDIAYAYYKADEPESAIAAADRFIKLHPQNPYVDYAYYLKGIVNYNRSQGFLDRFIPTDATQRDPGSTLHSFQDFAELIRRYPNSRYAEDAQKRMIYLRNNLAKHEINVARYYMRRGAYLAAANRAQYVVQQYQRTTSVKNALLIMIEAYNKLGMEQLAGDTQRVLVLNDEQGRFLVDEIAPEQRSLGRKIWDYLELDKN